MKTLFFSMTQLNRNYLF